MPALMVPGCRPGFSEPILTAMIFFIISGVDWLTPCFEAVYHGPIIQDPVNRGDG